MPSFADTTLPTANGPGDLEHQLLLSSSTSNCHQQHDRTGFPTVRGYHQQQSTVNDQSMPPPAPDLHPTTSSGPRSTDSSAPDSPTGPGGSTDDMMAIGHAHGYDQLGGGGGGYHSGGHPATGMQLPASLQLYSQLYHASAAGNMTRHHHHHHHYHQPGDEEGGGGGVGVDDDHLQVSGATQRPTQQAVAATDHGAVWRPYWVGRNDMIRRPSEDLPSLYMYAFLNYYFYYDVF